MTPSAFIAVIRRLVYDAIVGVCNTVLVASPSRKRADFKAGLRQWWSHLSSEDRTHVRTVIHYAVRGSIFRALALLDGVVPFRQDGVPNGHFEVNFVTEPEARTHLLNRPAESLHDLFAWEIPYAPWVIEGAWTNGPFDNEEAQAWLGELAGSEDVGPIRSALVRVTLAEGGKIGARAASRALAAAEVVAVLAGRSAEALPVDLPEWVSDGREADERLVEAARAAVTAVLEGDSELRELWRGSEKFDEWEGRTRSLLARLS